MIEIIAIGTIATAFADIWQQMLKQIAGIPAANWSVIGRWVAGFHEGHFYRPAIAADPGVPHEAAIGWAFHYFIGTVYAAMFIGLGTALGTGFGLFQACGFGLATLAAPWFLMKPALGLGLFGRRAPNPNRDLLATTATHLAFGFGLYAGSTVILAN